MEYINYTATSTADYAIVVNKYGGSGKTLEVFMYTNGSSVYTNNITPVDAIFGHAAVPTVVAVGAIAANDPNNDNIESFSSQGPVTISNPSSENRPKPDICGIDGVSVTGAGGFSNPFYGTSAAAPHIAAIAAQLWAQLPTSTGNQIRGWITASAVDLGTTGFDNVFGYGRADSYNAFLVNKYTVAYNGNGNTGGTVPASGNYNYGATVTVSGNTGSLVKAGNTFSGWNTAGDGSGTSYAGGATFTMGAANVTLYAQWTVNQYSVSYAGNGNTGGTEPASGNYNYGSTVTVSGNTGSLIKTGNTFSGWNTAADGSGTSYAGGATFTMGAANVTLYAQWTINQYKVTFVSDANGTITGTLVQTVSYGGSCTQVTAVPATGYHFTGWTGDYTGTTNPLTITNVTSDMTVTANFAINKYPVTVSSSGNGTVRPSGIQLVNHGDILKDTAEANTGYHFSNWTVNGGVAITDGDITGEFSITGDGSITANFAVNDYTVNITSGDNGTVNPSGDMQVSHGEILSVTAQANIGYHFANWTVTGSVTITDNDETGRFTITGNGTIQATFTINNYTVSISSNGNGTVNPSGDRVVAFNGMLMVVADPSYGYKFVKWNIAGGVTVIDGDSTGEFKVTDNGTIEATFDVASNISGSNIKNKILGNNFIVYPNPVTGTQKVTLYFKGKTIYNAKLTIYDQIGNIVYFNMYEKIGGDDKRTKEFARWDMNNRKGRKVASGVYLAVLLAKDSAGSVQKYIARIGVKEE